MSTQSTGFDPNRYKETTRQQWQTIAEPWFRWTLQIQQWLGPSTEVMLDLANVGPGTTVLDVAAGAGEPAITAAKRVGPMGKVLATDISANILGYAAKAAASAGLANLETRVMDGENLELRDESFDVVMSRVGLIYFPDQQRALSEMRRVLKPGGRIAALVYSTPDRNQFFSIPVGIIRRRAQLPPPLPGQPGPFSLGGPGALEEAYRRAGFQNIEVRAVDAPVVMSSTAECLQFEQESFGALHQMMSGLSEADRADTWAEVERELSAFETPNGFSAPCEMLVGVATK
jgi:SAM-dependent methyltransferase